jgi:hypothetical protein
LYLAGVGAGAGAGGRAGAWPFFRRFRFFRFFRFPLGSASAISLVPSMAI